MILDLNTLSDAEKNLLTWVGAGIEETRSFMGRLTEYHGGPAETEYILTTHIARALLDNTDQVAVEHHYAEFLNPISAQGFSRKNFRQTRVDVCVKNEIFQPHLVAEIKIRVRKFTDIKADVERIRRLINVFRPVAARRTLGLAVFQVHVAARKNWYGSNKTLSRIVAIENAIKMEFEAHTLGASDCEFAWHSFQASEAGVVGRELDGDPSDPEASWGREGHAVRYHAIVLRKHISSEDTPTAGSNFVIMKNDAMLRGGATRSSQPSGRS